MSVALKLERKMTTGSVQYILIVYFLLDFIYLILEIIHVFNFANSDR